MADKRMFSKKITDSDAFIELSASAQALYFHLNQSADDDGFNNQIQIAMMKAHASNDDLVALLGKNFVIRFESGVIVIKHWRLHNTLRKDRYNPTNYQEELSLLGIKDNGTYTLSNMSEVKGLPVGCQTVATVKDSIDKDSIGKDNIYNSAAKNAASKKFVKPTVEEVKEYCKERNNTVDAETFIDFYESKDWYVGKNKMKDWKAAVRTWERSRTNIQQYNRKPSINDFTQRKLDDELAEMEKLFLEEVNS